MSSQVMSAVKRQLKDAAVTFTDEWFDACVDWVKENNAHLSQLSQDFLKKEVMEQWLDVNLSDLGSSCLPPRLTETKLVVLPGRYSLQVNCAEDIGESAYSQWNKLKKLENENTNVSADVDTAEIKANWEPKGRRCVYLTMTDGTQEVYGMEMVPVSCLSLDLKVGTKVLITGPVDCRRGVLQLKPCHVRILGGEVEGLMEEFARERILQIRLNKQDQPQQNPPAPLPRPVYKKPPGSQNSSKLKGKSSGAQSQQSYSSNSSSHIRSTQPTSNSSSKWNGSGSGVGTGSRSTGELHPDLAGVDFDDDPFGDDDDDFMDIDETLLISQSEHVTQPLTQSSQSRRQPFSSNSNSDRAPTSSTQSTLDQHWDSSSTSTSSTRGNDTKPFSGTFKPPPPKKPATSATFKPPSSSTSSSLSSGRDLKYVPPAASSSSTSTATSASLSSRDTKFKPPPSASSTTTSSCNTKSDVEILGSFDKKKEIPPVIDILDDDDDDFAFSMMDDPSLDFDPTPAKKLKVIPKTPYQYIKVIKDSLRRKSFRTGQIVFVKACVATLVSKIKMDSSGGWTLVVSLNDGSGFLEASMGAELLNRIIGFSAADMKRMKMSGDASASARISSGLSQLSDRLCHMNGIFGITMASSPVISSFDEVETRHISALRDRLSLIK